MERRFANAAKSEVFRLLYSVNQKSGFNNPYFVFKKRKNGKFRNKFLKNFEISFIQETNYGKVGIFMIIEDLIKDEIIKSKSLKRNIDTNVKESGFTIRSFEDLYDERFYKESPYYNTFIDPVKTRNIALFKNGNEKPFDIDFLFINGDLHFSSFPVGDKFSNFQDDTELYYLQDIEDFHLEYWDEKLNVASNSYLKIVR
ncbi:hypothetical protein [Chryseobacterium gambrini]|uniref:Uncharacterized protein n=1 Tax=Chryseobacterium gambrini TaxID=373672 RepID=A0A1N7NZ32_9FLAO|nr:hypothetical protein [Chryseobacterium gambrini]SIT03546.1 hypothetical protein SAMN05421785_105231 [Chryseobacterium gambrini]